MRTLKFTEEEVALIQRALGMAEQQMARTRMRYIRDTVNVRGAEGVRTEALKEVDPMFEVERQMSDLALKIIGGWADA